MTKQYLVGELSVLTWGVQQAGGGLLAAELGDLRSQVERAEVSSLGPLVAEVLSAADSICWMSLERRDMESFERQATAAAELREFALCSDLLDPLRAEVTSRREPPEGPPTHRPTAHQ